MKARVYGLPRSGTNFLEYLIRNNTDLEYKNEFGISPYFGKYSAIKHCKPKDDDKDLYILIFKNKNNFTISYNKWRKTPKDKILKMYDIAMNDYVEFYKNNKNKTVIIAYEQLIGNEIKLLNHLSTEYGVGLTKDIDIPKKRMDKSGGKGITGAEFRIDERNLLVDKDSVLLPYIFKLD